MSERIRMNRRIEDEVRNFPFELIPAKEALLNSMAEAMLDAYQGSIDYEGENLQQTVDELKRVFRGSYGPLMEEASYLVMEGDQVLSGLLTCLYRGEPSITYTFTRKSAQRLGYATLLINKAFDGLYRSGYHLLFLYVTLTNKGAVRLYESLGFQEVPLTTVTQINID